MTSPYPRYHDSHTRCLNGTWAFSFLGDVAEVEQFNPDSVVCNDTMSVPGVFDASPRYSGRRGVSLYRTYAEITPECESQLRLDGLGLWARIFVDGKPLGTHQLPYSGWHVRLPASSQSRRQIDILIDNRLCPQRTVLVEPYFDFYLYGGIYRGVWLREFNGPTIERIGVRVLDRQRGRLQVHVETMDEVPHDTPMTIGFDQHQPMLIEDGHWQGKTRTFEISVPDPRQWSPDNPQLHTLHAHLGEDHFTTRFGLRDIRVEGAQLLLNDEPLKLKGICRHEAHPQFGPALPDAQIVHDIQLLKSLGCNFVRGSHYPQDPRFLDLCDEHGLLVFEESIGWQPRVKHFENPEFVDRIVQQTREMIRSSFNHPSVILWGFLNEADTDAPSSRPVYERIVKAIREEDPTRPVTFATCKPFDDLNLDLADVISVNAYPGWYADMETTDVRPLEEIAPKLDAILAHLADNGLGDRPFILSEVGAGAIYGWHDPLRNHWSEGYQADLLETVLHKFREDHRITGLAIWQFCDGRTYANSQALARPRSFNNKGIFDEYRRPKLAVQVVAKG